MDQANQDTAAPKRKPDRWARMRRRIIVNAIVVLCFTKLMDWMGWKTWDNFTDDANQFADSLIAGSARISPVSLWQSITLAPNEYDNGPVQYMRRYDDHKIPGVKAKVLNWLGYYWYTDSGKPFWAGRIILALALLFGILVVREEYQKSRNKTAAALIFPFNVVFKTIILLLTVGIVALVFYGLIHLFIFLGTVVAGLGILTYSAGDFAKCVYDETKAEAVDASKSSVIVGVGYMWNKYIKKKPRNLH